MEYFLYNQYVITGLLFLILVNFTMTFRFKSRFTDIFLHPLSMIYIAILSVNSVYQAKYGKGIFWKDRFYSISREEDLENKKAE